MRRVKEKGFTLTELLVVITIMAVLATVALVALKPALRLSDVRDVRRGQDINQILTGIHECIVDKRDNAAMSACLGTYVVGNTYEIVSGDITSGCKTVCSKATADNSCLRLEARLTDYFVQLPSDPSVTKTGHTGYSITVYNNGMTVLEACKAELGTVKASR